MKPTFNFHIDIDADLTIEEIWPDGDAPENPTVDDVKLAFYGKEKPSRYDAKHSAEDWSLLDDLDVTITKNEPPCPECHHFGWHKLQCSRRPPSSPGGGAATKESTDTAAPLSEAGPTPEKDTP